MSSPPTPRRDRRRERHEQTRQEIVAAAWTAARTDGLSALSLRGLARSVGMEPQSLYTYFASKADIYDAMFLEANHDLLTRQQPPADVKDPLQHFLAGAHAFVAFATEDPVRYLLLFQRTVPGFTPSAASMAVAMQVLAAPVAALGDLGVHDPTDVDLVLSGLVGLVAQQNTNEPHGTRWRTLTERMVMALLREVGAA